MKCTKYLLLISFLFYGQNTMATCYAGSFSALTSCIVSNSDIVMTSNIELQINEMIDISNKSNISLDGNGYTISESSDRFDAAGTTNSYMLKIFSSDEITIDDLLFRSYSASDTDCEYGGKYHNADQCYGAIAILSSDEVWILNVDINMEKTFLLQITGSTYVSINYSKFNNASTYGIWTGNVQSSYLWFYLNYFEGIGANALSIEAADNVTVAANTFYSNHVKTQFSGNGGGQMVLEAGPDGSGSLEDILITSNTFTAGLAAHSNGIELADFSEKTLHTGIIEYNTIDDHNQGGIVINERVPGSDLRELIIQNNDLNDNLVYGGSQIIIQNQAFVDIENNKQKVGVALKNGSFSGTAKTCDLDGNSTCTIDITWSSIGLSDPYVYVRSTTYNSTRQLFSSNGSGTVSSSWIDSTGKIFELYEGSYSSTSEPIASINVIAVP